MLAFHARVVFYIYQLPTPLFRVLDICWSGVDLFLVLSGFLITGILLDSRESASYFRTFYLRRALRIFPLYFAYLFLILVAARRAILWISGVDWWSSTNVAWYLTYLLNWKPDHGYNDLYLGHLWSLAIEEQFYFVWPLIVWLCPPRRLGWLCAAVAVLALGCRISLGLSGENVEAIYRVTISRMDALALGALVATGVRYFRPQLDRWAGRVLFFAVIGLLNVMLWMRSGYWNDPLMRTAGVSCLSIIFGGVVFRAACSGPGRFERFFSSRILRSLGKYSYAMYVLHSVPYHLTADMVRSLPLVCKYLYFPAMTAVAYGLAWISWRLLEQPFLKLKHHFPYAAEEKDAGADAALAATP